MPPPPQLRPRRHRHPGRPPLRRPPGGTPRRDRAAELPPCRAARLPRARSFSFRG